MASNIYQLLVCRFQFCRFSTSEGPDFSWLFKFLDCCDIDQVDISPFLAQGSSHHLKENTTLCIKGKFSCFCCRLLTFSKINFQKIISEHYQSVKLFGSRSGPRKSSPGLGPNCCIGYLSRLQKSQLALIIKHKYILVLKIMSAAYFQMNLRLLLSWKQTL